MVNGIGSYNNCMNCLPMVRSRSDPAEMFSKMFNQMDTDGSGTISQSELDTWAEAMSNKTGNSIDTTDAVSKYDTNGDGVLSQDELKSFMQATMPQPGGMAGMGGEQGQGDLFSAIDSNSDGGISQSELDTWAQAMSNKTGNSIDTTDAVSKYDTNGDGVLSQDELKSFMQANGIKPPPPPPGDGDTTNGAGSTDASSTTSADSIISEYDTNGDGVLSSSELQGYLDNSNATSSNTLVQEALSAYGMNVGDSSFSTLENALANFGGSSGYMPIDLSA